MILNKVDLPQPEGPITARTSPGRTLSETRSTAISGPSGVIAPSGCGKSTLFNIIGGLLDGYQGAVTVGGETVRGPHPAIGMVFQEESTFPWRTLIENVAFPLEIAGMRRKDRFDKAKKLIA